MSTALRRWPRPADTAVDRARAIARQYRDELHRADPARCAVLDTAAREFGEGFWLLGVPQYSDTELVTLAELAARLGEPYKTVWAWWRRGRIPREPCGLFHVDDVQRALAAWRADRETRAARPTRVDGDTAG